MEAKPEYEAIQAFFASLVEAGTSGNRSAYVNHFMPDAVLLLPRRPALIGHQAIGEWFDKFQNELELVLDNYQQLQIDVLGEVALVRSFGSGHYLVKATGTKVPIEQNYLDILRYVDGRWLFAYHEASSANSLPSVWDTEWEDGD